MAKNTTKYQMKQNLTKEYQKELVKDCRRLIDIANKRLKRIEDANMPSYAYSFAMREGKFSGKGISKDWNALMHEYGRVVAFLNMETSTLGGARQVEMKIRKMLGGEISDNQRKLVFDIFRRLEETNAVSANEYGSERLITYIASNVNSDISNALETADIDSEEWQDFFNEQLKQAQAELDRIYDTLIDGKWLQSTFKHIKW